MWRGNPPPPDGIPCTMVGTCNVRNQCGFCGVIPERRPTYIERLQAEQEAAVERKRQELEGERE